MLVDLAEHHQEHFDGFKDVLDHPEGGVNRRSNSETESGSSSRAEGQLHWLWLLGLSHHAHFSSSLLWLHQCLCSYQRASSWQEWVDRNLALTKMKSPVTAVVTTVLKLCKMLHN